MSLKEAVRLMREAQGDTLVVTRPLGAGRVEPLGLLTDRDIVVFLGGESANLDQVCVEQIMSADLVVAYEDAPLDEWISIARLRGVRRLPIVDQQGALKGLVSIDDLLEALGTELVGLAKVCGWPNGTEKKVAPC
jgi:CBS domain-containing protein